MTLDNVARKKPPLSRACCLSVEPDESTHQAVKSNPVWTLALLGLCYAGFFKGIPVLRQLQVDATALFILLCLVGVVVCCFRGSAKDSRTALALGVLWVAYLPGVVIGLWGHGAFKILLLFTVTLLCAIAPTLFLTTCRSRVWLLRGTVVGGLFMAISMVLWPDSLSRATLGRLVADGSSSIGSARVIGAAAVAAFVQAVASGHRRWLNFALAGVLCVFLTAIGSRGPFAAMILSIGSTFLLARLFKGKRRLKVVLLGLTLMAILLGYVTQSTSQAASRIGEFILGQSKDDIRSTMLVEGLVIVPTAPLGIGWGEFAYLPGVSTFYGLRYTYPHNIVMEVFLEGGWIAGVLFLWICMLSFRGFVAASGSITGTVLASLGFYWFLVAQTSNDINSNRTTWVFLALGLMVGASRKRYGVRQRPRSTSFKE